MRERSGTEYVIRRDCCFVACISDIQIKRSDSVHYITESSLDVLLTHAACSPQQMSD